MAGGAGGRRRCLPGRACSALPRRCCCGSGGAAGRASACATGMGRSTTSPFPSMPARRSSATTASSPPAAVRLGYSSMVTPGTVFDYVLAERRLVSRKVQRIPSGYDAVALCQRGADGHRGGRGRGADHAAAAARHAAGRAAVPLRLWQLRAWHGRQLRAYAPQPGRSRHRLRAGACARRRREGAALVAGRQARAQGQHLRRLHRLRRGAGGGGAGRGRGDRHQGCQRRRHAGGGGGEPARRSCGAAPSPRCRSSTCCTPCWTPACR